MGPNAVARTQRLRQDKAAKTSQHCGCDNIALRGWCPVDSEMVHEVLKRSGQNGLFCSANDTDLAKVNVPRSMGYEDAMRLCSAMGPIALGLHTTPQGFAIWCLPKDEPYVRAHIDPELFRSIHPRYEDLDVNTSPLYNITGVPADIHANPGRGNRLASSGRI